MQITPPSPTDEVAEHLKELEDAFIRICAEAEAEARKASTNKQRRG